MHPCYEQSCNWEQLSVHEASSPCGWHELSCRPKLQLSHPRGILCLRRAESGMSTCGQSCNMFQYACPSMNESLTNNVAPNSSRSERTAETSQIWVEPAPCLGVRIYSTSSPGSRVWDCSMDKTCTSREVFWGSANKAQGSWVCTRNCTWEPSDTEVWARRAGLWTSIRGCHFQVCLLLCAPVGDWDSPGNPTFTHPLHVPKGTRAAVGSGKKEPSSKTLQLLSPCCTVLCLALTQLSITSIVNLLYRTELSICYLLNVSIISFVIKHKTFPTNACLPKLM